MLISISRQTRERRAMSGVLRKGGRLRTAIELRDAALVVLKKRGKQIDKGSIVFEQHSPQKPTPHLSLSLTKHPLDGHDMLSVWATLKGKHGKVLNIETLGERVELVSFRRGEWEGELLAMGRAPGVAVH
jgi:hypothetical protein